jgi:hypothetical protein
MSSVGFGIGLGVGWPVGFICGGPEAAAARLRLMTTKYSVFVLFRGGWA